MPASFQDPMAGRHSTALPPTRDRPSARWCRKGSPGSFTIPPEVRTSGSGSRSPGWDIPWWNEPATFLGFLLSFLAFMAKWSFLMFVFVWVRWTIPRLKYDILMRLGWKIFLPTSLVAVMAMGAYVTYVGA